MPAKNQKKRRTRVTPTRTSEVLDVKMAAELLTVSPDTVYDLFKRGELPGRKVGRKWLTTRNAVLRWIESSSENNTLAEPSNAVIGRSSPPPSNPARCRSRIGGNKKLIRVYIYNIKPLDERPPMSMIDLINANQH
jgi:excisionase family DNA binding protein